MVAVDVWGCYLGDFLQGIGSEEIDKVRLCVDMNLLRVLVGWSSESLEGGFVIVKASSHSVRKAPI